MAEMTEQHSVLLAKGAILSLDYFSLLLQGNAPGVRERISNHIENEESGRDPGGAITPLMHEGRAVGADIPS